ncbi:MAG TPA: carboxypeptidase-like regulatory domain-containing protein [Pyrinomonadaceae bacterium]
MKSSSMARIVLVTVVLVAGVIAAQAQTQATARVAKPSATVSGRVTIKGKGAPGISVTLRKEETGPSYDVPPRATTDQDGNYKITNAAGGTFYVTPVSPAYVIANADGPGKRIVISEGEAIENIDFSLVKGGVITGKITDSEGRPVIQTQVRLYRQQTYPPGTLRPGQNYPTNFQTTDDRGVYRFFGLLSGKYTASVGRDNSGTTVSGRVAYGEVFYPDVSENAKATVIEVSEGSETTDIDIVLGAPITTFSASGRIVDADGVGQPGLRFTLQRLTDDHRSFTSALTDTNARGEFVVENLAPGRYAVYLYQEPNSELRAENPTFEVMNSDVTGITIKLIKGGAISGMVVLDTQNKNILSKLTQLQVVAYVFNLNNGGSAGGSSRSTIGPDGSFRVAGLNEGIASLQVMPSRDIKGLMISRIERDGAVTPSRGLEIKEGEQITGIKLVVAYGSATLRGVINSSTGQIPPGTRFVVSLKTPDNTPVSVRQPTVDERGHFIVESVPPGTYEVTVNVIGTRLVLKNNVTLQDGQVGDVQFTLNLQDNQ